MNRLLLLMSIINRHYLLPLLLCCHAGWAVGNNQLQYNGVITQGAVYTDDNNFYGDSEDGVSFEFVELSLNTSYRITPSIRLAGQALYLHSGNVSDEIDIDYLFVDWEVLSSSEATYGLRVGLVKNPFGLYNDARDVAFTRPGVFLPQSIYPDHFRDLLLSSESVLLYANLFTDSGQWNIELGAGEPRIDQFGEAEIDNASDEEIVVGRIMYEDGGGVWRAGISAIEGKISFDNDISSILGFPYPAIETEAQLTQYIASFQYNIDDWTFTGEYMIKITETDSPIILLPTPFGVIPLDIDIKETGEAYYLQAQRRINSNWSVMSRWDVDYVDKDDRSGNDTEPSLLGTLGYGQYSKDYTLGLRWDIQENIMLNTEYHYVKGASWLSLLDNPNGPSSKYWNMLSIAISYRF